MNGPLPGLAWGPPWGFLVLAAQKTKAAHSGFQKWPRNFDRYPESRS